MVRKVDAKRALVGAGARVLFYPTLLYNVVRNKMQADFRWWDQIDQFLLMGAVPFPKDVPRLHRLGVRGVITLNEPYETLVPSSLYQAHGIDHLVLPTRDYLYAPALEDICQAVNFIHRNASCERSTYVHCKAGRGRSTTIVVAHKRMTPATAFEYVQSIRHRVLLHPSQWQAIQEFSKGKLELPALKNQKSTDSSAGIAVLTTGAKPEGNGAATDACTDPCISLHRAVRAKPKMLLSCCQPAVTNAC